MEIAAKYLIGRASREAVVSARKRFDAAAHRACVTR